MDGHALVGRERETAALDAAVRGSAAGTRCIVMLSGEPGIGKTRMLEDLAERALRAGSVVAWGRTWEFGLTPSFWPWIQVLAALESSDDRAPALGTLEQHTDAAARLSRFSEVRAFLQRRAALKPLTLLLDDLHAADQSSLQLLEYLLPELVGRRVLIALAARDTDTSPETASSLGRIQRSAQRLALARLGPAEVATLVGPRADPQRVFELSEGNPLFIEELLASQHSRGLLALPALSSVRAVIRERVARLPEATRAALGAGAIIGREFSGRVIGLMIETSDAPSALAPAMELGIVATTAPDRYRFSHALVADAIAGELSESERARLQLCAAHAIEQCDRSNSSAIAHHLLAAGPAAADAAVSAARRAAADCMARFAFEDAAALLERALHALSLVAADDVRRRAELLCARAEALQHAGQHARAAELCDRAAEVMRPIVAHDARNAAPSDRTLFARIALVRGLEFQFGRTDPVLVEFLREALTWLGDAAVPLRAKLLARLAAAEQPALDPDRPIKLAYEAIALAKAFEARDRLDVSYVATAALVDYLEPEVIERLHYEVLALARGRDRSISVHTRLRLCFSAIGRIERAAFDAAVQAFGAEAASLGLLQWTRQVHMLDALGALLDGRFADAERASSEFEAASERLGDRGARFVLDVHRAMLAWVRTAAIDPATRERLAGYVPGRAAVSAWFAVQDGSRRAARAALDELDGRIPPDSDLSVMVAYATAFAGSAEEAARVYAALAPRAGQIVLAAMVGCAVMDIVDRVLLVLAAKCGNWQVVDSHAERAIAVSQRLGSPVWIARTQADWADALELRAADGDRVRAGALRSSARQIAEQLDMPGLIERCRVGAAPEPAQPALSPAARAQLEFAKQGELWLVRGRGEAVHVKDSRGMQMLARLVELPASPLHALDLAGGGAAADGGDAGAMLDARARSAYRTRLATLAAEQADAETAHDLGRLERANREIEQLSAELERAFGLGGRERRVGAASERARSNVQRRIAHALEQIRAASPQLGEHLIASIRTGTYCVYEPK